MDLTGWTRAELLGKMDYEGGAAEMINYGGLGEGDTVEGLEQIHEGLGLAFRDFAKAYRHLEEVLGEVRSAALDAGEEVEEY